MKDKVGFRKKCWKIPVDRNIFFSMLERRKEQVLRLTWPRGLWAWGWWSPSAPLRPGSPSCVIWFRACRLPCVLLAARRPCGTKLGSVPAQQLILLPVPAAVALAPFASLGSHSPKLFLYTMPFFMHLFLRKSAYLVLNCDLADKSYRIHVGTWLVGPWKGTKQPRN